MKKTLKQIALGTFLAGALAISAFKGIESLAEDKNSTNETSTVNATMSTNNTIDVSGRWYQEASGGFKDGWCWSWVNLWLEQKGTNISGYYRWEAYDNDSVKGSISSNKLILEYKNPTSKEQRYLVGTVSNDTLSIEDIPNPNESKGWFRVYTKITNDLPLMDPFYKWHTKKEDKK